MDTSEENVNMCRKAVEIQEMFQRRLIDGEWENQLVFVDWKHDSRMGGLEGTILQRTSLYGLSYKNKRWINYNGLIRGRHYTVDITDRIVNIIWLPRQDQLQGMIKENPKIHIHYRFDAFLNMPYDKNSTQRAFIILNTVLEGASMEQLWLAFVMYKKYSKVWNGSDWIINEPQPTT